MTRPRVGECAGSEVQRDGPLGRSQDHESESIVMGTSDEDLPASARDPCRSVELQRKRQTGDPDSSLPADVQRCLCELQVSRIELQVQNEELRASRQSLEESRNRYADLYDGAPLGYVTLDGDGWIREANLTAAAMFHSDRAALVGRRLSSYIAAEDEPLLQHHLRRCISEAGQVSTELHLKGPQGAMTSVQLRSVVAEEAAGRRVYRTAIMDITDRMEVERALKSLNETLEDRIAERTAELGQRAGQLRALAAELSQTEQRERRQLAHLLHDELQQLLVASRMHLGHVRRCLRDKELVKMVGQVDGLLDQAITESRSLVAQLSPTVLYERGLAAGLEWLAGQSQEKYDLAVEVEADRGAEPAEEATLVFLFQAVRELLLNVAKHAQAEHAWVRVSRTEDRHLRIEVRDDGVGFDVAEPTGPTADGGFGMFSIRERLELLGGRLEIASSPGQGTQVTIFVPLGEEVAPPASAAPPAARLRVLLADDHPIVLKGLAEALAECPEIEVVGQAADGQQAVALARETRPDVVLMDIMMPGMSGIEATHQILEFLPQTRIIGLSAHEEDETAAAMVTAGAVAYLRKDLRADILTATILAQSPSGRQNGS